MTDIRRMPNNSPDMAAMNVVLKFENGMLLREGSDPVKYVQLLDGSVIVSGR